MRSADHAVLWLGHKSDWRRQARRGLRAAQNLR